MKYKSDPVPSNFYETFYYCQLKIIRFLFYFHILMVLKSTNLIVCVIGFNHTSFQNWVDETKKEMLTNLS